SIFLRLAAGAFWLWRGLSRRAQVPAVVGVEEKPDPSKISIADISEQSLVTLELGYGLVHLADERKGAPLVTRLTGLRRQLCQAFGFVIPRFRIRDSFDLAPDQYRVLLGGPPL